MPVVSAALIPGVNLAALFDVYLSPIVPLKTIELRSVQGTSLSSTLRPPRCMIHKKQAIFSLSNVRIHKKIHSNLSRKVNYTH